MSLSPPDVAVLIVNWNTVDLIGACLRSLESGLNAAETEVIVFDNASSDDSARLVREEFPSVCLHRSNTNVGFVQGNNQAYRLSNAQTRYVLLLNPDTELDPGALTVLVAWMDSHPKTGACGPLTRNSDGSLQPTWNRFPTAWSEIRGFHDRRFLGSAQRPTLELGMIRALPVPQLTDWVGGSCLLVRRAAIENDLGGVLLDPEYAMYSEETDLCFRLKKNGWEVFFVPAAEIIHHGGQSSRQMPVRTLELLYESKIRFFQKHYGKVRTLGLKLGLTLMASLKYLVFLVKANREQRLQQMTILRVVWM